MDITRTNDQAVNEAMAEVEEALPNLDSAPIHEVQIELGIDSNGRDAAFITVILEDGPSGEPYPWTRLRPIHDLIWDVFTARDVPRGPYVTFVLKSEVEEEAEDELEAAQG